VAQAEGRAGSSHELAEAGTIALMNTLDNFHPAVANWFRRTYTAPTEPQLQAWPVIQSGQHVLIAAPTGSGKTLAAFLAAIDALVRQGVRHQLRDQTQVVYVSPLKALSNDIHKNLEEPLAGIRQELAALGFPEVEIRTLVRTGDTPQADRDRMRRKPPHILVTTPESLYIVLTSEFGRKALASARTVIVDEIHALAPNKRGSHLTLSLERLEHITGNRLTRIGLSATQKPIEEVARFLVGLGGRPAKDLFEDGADPMAARPSACVIVDTGHVRRRDLAIEVPEAPLEAVMSGEVWGQVYERLTGLIQEHRSTLVEDGDHHRHAEEQRGDAQTHLRQRGEEQEVEQAAPGDGLQAARPDPQRDHGGHERGSQQAVVELHGQGILEEVAVPRLEPGPARRDEPSRHEREGVEDPARAESRDERAGQRGDEGQRDHPRDAAPENPRSPAGAGAGGGPAPQEFRGGPDRNEVDHECECQMRGQAILAHVGTLGEPALHHVPAQDALRTQETQDHREPAPERARQLAPQRERHERRGKGEPDQPGPEPVPVFPEIDAAEPGRRHVGVDRAVLRNLPVPGELLGPGPRVQRGDDARDRLPFGDGEPRLGEAGRAPDEHEEIEHAGPDREPPAPA